MRRLLLLVLVLVVAAGAFVLWNAGQGSSPVSQATALAVQRLLGPAPAR